MPYGSRHDISARIREVRGKLKKAEFADTLGIPRPNFYKYEDGRQPPADVLQKIADYGGVSVKWLLTGKEEDKDVGTPRLSDQSPVVTEPARPCEVQEFLLVQVLLAVEEYMEKYKHTYSPKDRARLITALYNYCAREDELPSEFLVEDFLASTAPD
jgi:transcriptional regulator with XRE-family HTH domain